MIAVLIAFNILAGLFLIGVVLLQSGKGADMGAAFGGSSSTVFGASGAGNVLTKITAGTAAVFMGTSLILAVTSTRYQSVFVGASEPTPIGAPAATAAPPGQPTDGVDAKAAAEAGGQQPLAADETGAVGNTESPASSDLGPAGQAGAIDAGASPPANDEPTHEQQTIKLRVAPKDDAVEDPAGTPSANPAGAAPKNPAGPTPPPTPGGASGAR